MIGFNQPQPYGLTFGQPYQTYAQQNAVVPDERIWVQNETAAEAYLLAPNGFARLWDSSSNRFYEKRADATGRPLPMDIYEYKRILPQIQGNTEETSKLSYEEINAKFEEISQRIEALEKAKKGAVKNAKQSDTDNSSL